jgi:hypothetical protein
MNEYIEVKFRRRGSWMKVTREVAGRGIELDEPDPIVRSVSIGLEGFDEVTRYRMRRLRQIKGWEPGQFKLNVSAEGGVLVLRGVDADALPEGRYSLRVLVEEADARQSRRVTVEHDGFGEHGVDLTLDDRTIVCDDDPADLEIARVLASSSFDGTDAVSWLNDPDRRPTRKACFLNLLASLRVRPGREDALIADIERFFVMSNDRGYARVDRGLLDRLETLALDDDAFYREGAPRSRVHLRLLDAIPDAEKPLFPPDCLVSFRGEGRPSLQTVIAKPPAGLAHTYAEFDLDLGNPLQDIEGFVVHMFELADSKATDHLDLHKALSRTAAAEFLYYRVSRA